MDSKLPESEVDRLIDAVDHTRLRTEQNLERLVESVAEVIEKTPEARHDEFISWFTQKVCEAIASSTRRCFECGGSGEKETGKLIRERHKCTYCDGSGKIPKLKLNTKF